MSESLDLLRDLLNTIRSRGMVEVDTIPVLTAASMAAVAEQLERIADRLDSWDKQAPSEDHELCVRRW